MRYIRRLRAAARLLKPRGGPTSFTREGAGPISRPRPPGRAADPCLRPVQPRAGVRAGHILVELRSGPGEARTLPPLVLFDAAGGHTSEARAIFEGRDGGPSVW